LDPHSWPIFWRHYIPSAVRIIRPTKLGEYNVVSVQRLAFVGLSGFMLRKQTFRPIGTHFYTREIHYFDQVIA
jgi:hypothetical protein